MTLTRSRSIYFTTLRTWGRRKSRVRTWQTASACVTTSGITHLEHLVDKSIVVRPSQNLLQVIARYVAGAIDIQPLERLLQTLLLHEVTQQNMFCYSIQKKLTRNSTHAWVIPHRFMKQEHIFTPGSEQSCVYLAGISRTHNTIWLRLVRCKRHGCGCPTHCTCTRYIMRQIPTSTDSVRKKIS